MSHDDRRSEAPAAPDEFPQAWWTVLHAMHGTPKDFQASRPESKFQVGNVRSCGQLGSVESLGLQQFLGRKESHSELDYLM